MEFQGGGLAVVKSQKEQRPDLIGVEKYRKWSQKVGGGKKKSCSGGGTYSLERSTEREGLVLGYEENRSENWAGEEANKDIRFTPLSRMGRKRWVWGEIQEKKKRS